MNNDSSSGAILGVIVGVLIVGGVIFFWANGTFNGSPSAPSATINVTPPAAVPVPVPVPVPTPAPATPAPR